MTDARGDAAAATASAASHKTQVPKASADPRAGRSENAGLYGLIRAVGTIDRAADGARTIAQYSLAR
ncbi:hypothetical protein [Rosistilla oblonga]|uniref:hypothetical protein n=1 Tax=Rosistilla oblonga TaxID=2527990 RepID=UPI0011AA45D3|nr:hypothetical protein [Rosistilla oblonga]